MGVLFPGLSPGQTVTNGPFDGMCIKFHHSYGFQNQVLYPQSLSATVMQSRCWHQL